MGKVIRKNYLKTLQTLHEQNLIKVVTGVRRCGKSTLLLQFQELLKAETDDNQVISINFDIPEYRFLAEKSWLEVYEFIEAALVSGKINYVFLDEIQNVVEFEKLLEGLFVHPEVDLYVTGSNACLLSSELATLLTGRAFEINVLPFSFAEYLEFTGMNDNIPRAFAEFVATGGFPEAVRLAAAGTTYAYQYLQNVFHNIYENDILTRYRVNSEHSYYKVVNFLTDTVGSPVSAGSIAKTMKNNNLRIDNKTVSSYIETLTAAYLFYRANRYDVKGKEHLSTQEKYYLVDTGLRNALLGKDLAADSGHLLENVVYLELIRRDNQVWTGKVNNLEVDFVARNKVGYTTYYQVSQTVQDPATLARELAPFDKIPDHNERILLTMDYETNSRNGVKQMNVTDWLLATKN
ncbi:MAG: ATP-binding protein [Prevotellaceae bacterium]|jgi:predicted AAA+ superfamily ATPase|nr:ATP-binding protein [Prevotellaceae bacterium]